MNTTSPARGGLAGTLVSAAIGVLAAVVCLAVIVLTDDDLDVVSGSPTSFGDSGAPSASGGDEAGVSAKPAQPDIAACTEKECPAIGPPAGPPGAFPYPPGTTAPEWTDDFCAGNQTTFDDVRQVRMSLKEVRDWYLTHLLAAGYGWGSYGPIQANPFTRDDAGNEVVLGWDDTLTTSDASRTGRLALEHGYGGQSVCGPAVGVVFIQVDLP